MPWASNQFLLFVLGSGAALGAVTNPVPVQLAIGDDNGSTQVLARIRS